MAQDNALYAVARIRCHENGLIGRERMARMIAGTAEEAMQVLTGADYAALPQPKARQTLKRSSRLNWRVPMRWCGKSRRTPR